VGKEGLQSGTFSASGELTVVKSGERRLSNLQQTQYFSHVGLDDLSARGRESEQVLGAAEGQSRFHNYELIPARELPIHDIQIHRSTEAVRKRRLRPRESENF
jgi:hypothetical protein